MTVKEHIGLLTQTFYYRRSKGQVGYKASVHDVNMDPVGTGRLDAGRFVGKTGKSDDRMEGATSVIVFYLFSFVPPIPDGS